MVEYEVILIWSLSPEVSVKEDVETLRASPFFKGMQILGFVQDTEPHQGHARFFQKGGVLPCAGHAHPSFCERY